MKEFKIVGLEDMLRNGFQVQLFLEDNPMKPPQIGKRMEQEPRLRVFFTFKTHDEGDVSATINRYLESETTNDPEKKEQPEPDKDAFILWPIIDDMSKIFAGYPIGFNCPDAGICDSEDYGRCTCSPELGYLFTDDPREIKLDSRFVDRDSLEGLECDLCTTPLEEWDYISSYGYLCKSCDKDLSQKQWDMNEKYFQGER